MLSVNKWRTSSQVLAVDVAELYRRTTEHWLDQVGAVSADRWTAPTPCSEWDVRALVNHVVSEQCWVPPLMAGSTLEQVGDQFEGDVLGDNPHEAATAAARKALAAVPSAVSEQRVVHVSFGLLPADEYARQIAADQLIHSWDLAAATGQDRGLDPEVVTAVAQWFADTEDAYRASGAIAERVSTDSQSPQAQLLGAFGRDANWVAE